LLARINDKPFEKPRQEEITDKQATFTPLTVNAGGLSLPHFSAYMEMAAYLQPAARNSFISISWTFIFDPFSQISLFWRSGRELTKVVHIHEDYGKSLCGNIPGLEGVTWGEVDKI